MGENKDFMIPYEYDRYMQTREKLEVIPFIKFPEDWEIQVIPPFAGATARFRVRKNNRVISVYLDCHDKLGAMGVPYWEIYPYNGDIYRCEMNKVKRLILAIGRELNRKL